jgi:quercetin dioxygenase-like cupin family protein
MAIVSTANAQRYHWGPSCDGWHLLALDDLSIIEERMPPGSSEQRHRHMYARQFFYVLEGELAIELEGAIHRLHRGEGLHVPPGSAHQVRNDGSGDARFVAVSSPKSHGDRIAAPLDEVAL